MSNVHRKKEEGLNSEKESTNSNSSEESTSNDSSFSNKTKQSSGSEMVMDKKMIAKIKNKVKEKMKNKYEKQIKKQQQTFILKEKIYREEISQLKDQVARRLNALENSNKLRDEIIYQKRELLLINKKLRTTIGNVKSRNLLLELQNTKLKNQIKRQSQKIDKKKIEQLDINQNNQEKKSNEDNESQETKVRVRLVNKKKNDNQKENENEIGIEIENENENENEMILEKILNQKPKKKNGLDRSTSLLKMDWGVEQTEVSFKVLGNRKQRLIRNDLGMKKSWSIADMELKESQQKIHENLWAGNLTKRMSGTTSTKRSNDVDKDLFLYQQLEDEKSLTNKNKSSTNKNKSSINKSQDSKKKKKKKKKIKRKLKKKKKKRERKEKNNKDQN
ncbi:hypothetical protein M0812_20795 [Anaeramoeba flamelloides]|uniref:Uncharacterized protein n=1 Tax=Anaeramoeba flamelloides TaxID=1746091 RepID=A0AAV7YSR2_9EUKA|nr:hypothetical protein M0812_20795 [Anaeramoeba flamelloides]